MAEPQYIPTPDDLTWGAKREFERAYEKAGARRLRCSRADFAAGYLAALVNLRARSQFSGDAWQRLTGSAAGDDPGLGPAHP